MDPENKNGNEPYLTVREMVAEIREDVKDLKAEAIRLASLPDLHRDHETRLRRVEVWLYGVPLSGFLAVGAVVAAIITN